MSSTHQLSPLFLLRALILASPFFLFAGAFVYHLNYSGVREMVYTFDRQTALISPLFPARRLEGIKNGQQLVREEPVYFTVRALRPYETAEILVHVVNPPQKAWKIGVAIEDDQGWVYDLHEPSPDGIALFSLAGVSRKNNSYRFVVSVPGLVATDEFHIDEIRVTLSGLQGAALLRQIIYSL